MSRKQSVRTDSETRFILESVRDQLKAAAILVSMSGIPADTATEIHKDLMRVVDGIGRMTK